MRNLNVIAKEIRQNWIKPSLYAEIYLRPMEQLTNMQSKYGADDASDIVARFLCNSQHWTGDVAKRIKAELKQMLKEYNNG